MFMSNVNYERPWLSGSGDLLVGGQSVIPIEICGSEQWQMNDVSIILEKVPIFTDALVRALDTRSCHFIHREN